MIESDRKIVGKLEKIACYVGKIRIKLTSETKKAPELQFRSNFFGIIAVVMLVCKPLSLLSRIHQIRTMTTARSHSLGTIVIFFYIVVKTGIGLKSLCVCCYSYAKRFFLSQNWMQEPV